MVRLVGGFLAGLSTGVYCLGTCLQVFVPILMAEKRTARSSFGVVIEFSLGRLLGYLFFGLIIGYIGELIQSQFLHLVVTLANLWIGVLMIVYVLGVIDKKFCPALVYRRAKWPILLGFLTGVNVCPPFLASLTYVFNLRSVLASVSYFLLFFLGTSIYILPVSALGLFTTHGWVKKLAQAAGVIAGLYFIGTSLVSLV